MIMGSSNQRYGLLFLFILSLRSKPLKSFGIGCQLLCSCFTPLGATRASRLFSRHHFLSLRSEPLKGLVSDVSFYAPVSPRSAPHGPRALFASSFFVAPLRTAHGLGIGGQLLCSVSRRWAPHVRRGSFRFSIFWRSSP